MPEEGNWTMPTFNFSIIFIRRLQLKSTESIGMCSQIPIRVTYIMHCTYKRNWAFVAIQIFSQSSYPEYNLCCHTNIRDQLVFGPYHLSSVVWLWLPSNSKVMLKLKCKRILKIKQKLFDSYNLFLKGSTTFFFFFQSSMAMQRRHSGCSIVFIPFLSLYVSMFDYIPFCWS